MITRERIYGTYAELEVAKIALHQANEGEIKARSKLESTRFSLIASGSITGKNEAEREACARGLLAPEYKALEDASQEARQRKHECELAALHVEALRFEWRLAEMEMMLPEEAFPMAAAPFAGQR